MMFVEDCLDKFGGALNVMGSISVPDNFANLEERLINARCDAVFVL